MIKAGEGATQALCTMAKSLEESYAEGMPRKPYKGASN